MILQRARGHDILSCPSSNMGMGGEEDGGNAGRNQELSAGGLCGR